MSKKIAKTLLMRHLLKHCSPLPIFGLLGKVSVYVLLRLIKFYQRVLSPFLPRTCRFYPSCSSYCAQALARAGLWRGVCLSLRRIFRCHPWHSGGYDPLVLPPEFDFEKNRKVLVPPANSEIGTAEK